MSSRELPFFQDPGHINLPSAFYLNGVLTHRLALKRGPKAKAKGVRRD